MKTFAFPTSLRRVFLSAVAASSLFSASQAFGQVNGPGPSDSMFFNTVINVPEDQAVFNEQVIGDVFNRTTQLNLSDGGAIEGSLRLGAGAEANISGGTISRIFAAAGSELNVTGGDFAFLEAGSGQTNISGGFFNGEFTTFEDSELTISGGSLGDGVQVRANSNVTLVGDEFRLNGAAYSDSTISLGQGDTFTGVLQDGSAFVFSGIVGDSIAADINLSTTALPAPTSDNFVIDSQNPTGAPLSLRTGQTLSVVEGGSLTRVFESVGGTINATGGSLDRVTTSESTIEISGGEIEALSVLLNGQLNVTGGETGNVFLSSSNASFSGSDTLVGAITAESSQLNLHDVTVGSANEINASDSVINISGDTNVFFEVHISDSEVNISDNARFTSGFSSFNSSQVSVSGGIVNGFNVNNSTANITGGEVLLNARNSEITMTGGTVGIGGGTIQIRNSDMTLSGGSIGDFFSVDEGTLEVLGGQIGDFLTLARLPGLSEGTINVRGGEIGSEFRISTTGVANISGGTIGDNFTVSEFDFPFGQGGTANISGGVIGNGMSVNFGGIANISGGQIGSNFEANDGSVVNISGGDIGLFLGAEAGSVINMSGGTIGRGFDIEAGSVFNMTDGTVGNFLDVFGEGNISGGTIGSGFDAESGSVVNVTDGTFGSGFDAKNDSVVTISGGTFGNLFTNEGLVEISGGSFLADDLFFSSGDTNFLGSEFFIDGVAVTGSSFTAAEGAILTGILDDGSSINIDLFSIGLLDDSRDFFSGGLTVGGTTVSIVAVPEPSSLALIALGGLGLLTRRRRS